MHKVESTDSDKNGSGSDSGDDKSINRVGHDGHFIEDRSQVTDMLHSNVLYTDSLPKIELEPLKSSTQFHAWLDNITVLLYSKRLLLLVQGSDIKGEGTPEFDTRLRAAFLVLYTSLHSSHHHWALDISIIEHDSESEPNSEDRYDPRRLWMAIQHRFGRVDSTSLDHSMKLYYTARMESSESINDYLDRLQVLRQQCEKAGMHINDGAHINRIATTITRDYNVQAQLFLNALHDGTNIDLDAVRDSLLTAEELIATRYRLDEETNSSISIDTANFSADLTHERDRNNDKELENDEEDNEVSFRGRIDATLATILTLEDLHCTLCGHNGHTRHNCPKRYINYDNCAVEDDTYDDDNDDDDYDVDSEPESRDDKNNTDYNRGYYGSNNHASKSDNYNNTSSNYYNTNRASMLTKCAFTFPTQSMALIACAYILYSASSTIFTKDRLSSSLDNCDFNINYGTIEEPIYYSALVYDINDRISQATNNDAGACTFGDNVASITTKTIDNKLLFDLEHDKRIRFMLALLLSYYAYIIKVWRSIALSSTMGDIYRQAGTLRSLPISTIDTYSSPVSPYIERIIYLDNRLSHPRLSVTGGGDISSLRTNDTFKDCSFICSSYLASPRPLCVISRRPTSLS